MAAVMTVVAADDLPAGQRGGIPFPLGLLIGKFSASQGARARELRHPPTIEKGELRVGTGMNERQQREVEQAPERSRAACLRRRGKSRQAIKAHCLLFVGYIRAEVRGCTT